MSDLWKATEARNAIVAEVVRVLGPEFKETGEELARRVQAHAQEFHRSLPVSGLRSAEDYQRHLDTVATAGYKAIFAGVGEVLRLLQDARRGGE